MLMVRRIVGTLKVDLYSAPSAPAAAEEPIDADNGTLQRCRSP
jgi:hypothetical protein